MCRSGLALLERAARRGLAAAAYLLGREYLNDAGTGRDPALAVRWLSDGADRNYGLAAFWLAELYDKGLGVERDPEQAARLRSGALATATPGEKNMIAWELSVLDDPLLRNGARAIEIMEDLLRDPELQIAKYWDTLAAAYAEAGRFEQAVSTQHTAIATLRSNAADEKRMDFDQRLVTYQSGQAHRD